MCGRFTLITDLTKIMERFLLEEIPFELQPRFNVAPGQMIPATLADGRKHRIGQLRCTDEYCCGMGDKLENVP